MLENEPVQNLTGKVFPVFPGWLVDSYRPGVVYWKTVNLYRKLQFIGNFKVIQYFVTIVDRIFNG